MLWKGEVSVLIFDRFLTVFMGSNFFVTRYEFSKHPPSLFEGPLMWKTAKKMLLLKKIRSGVRSSRADQIQDAFFVIVGGHLLHSVIWPGGCRDAIVCFDGYSDCTMLTQFHEQCRRISSKDISSDILLTFTLNMPVSCNQHSFFWNHNLKDRLLMNNTIFNIAYKWIWVTLSVRLYVIFKLLFLS